VAFCNIKLLIVAKSGKTYKQIASNTLFEGGAYGEKEGSNRIPRPRRPQIPKEEEQRNRAQPFNANSRSRKELD